MRVAPAIPFASALLVAACTSTPSTATLWRYAVTLQADGAALTARLDLPAGTEQVLRIAPDALPFVADVRVEAFGHERAIERRGDEFPVPDADGPRRVSWRFDVDGATRAIDEVGLAARRARSFLGSLQAFLLLPDADGDGDERFELTVDGGELGFACALPAIANGWGGRLADLREQPPCVFGRFAPRRLTVDRAALVIADLGNRSADDEAMVDDWIRGAAAAIADYYGTFPVSHLLLIVMPHGRRPGISGMTRGAGVGARILLDVPTRLPAAVLQRDWVLLHEMVHLALPSVPMAQHWLEEGNATYIEPLLQVRMRRFTELEVWQAMLDDYGQGLAPAARGGLDDDHSWGRTYYGGAIFWLMADVNIRRQTDNHKTLRDALRAIVAAGGVVTAHWPIEEVARVADEATGTTVLADLCAAMRGRAVPDELESLWRQLGVALVGGRVVVDDAAPLADVRRRLLGGD